MPAPVNLVMTSNPAILHETSINDPLRMWDLLPRIILPYRGTALGSHAQR
jgi:hypothetical protein